MVDVKLGYPNQVFRLIENFVSWGYVNDLRLKFGFLINIDQCHLHAQKTTFHPDPTFGLR